jgi:hypothetical protein
MSAMPFSDLRPTVVMADSSPLIHLAAVGQLDLLFDAVGQTPIKAERLRSNAKRHGPAKEILARPFPRRLLCALHG